MVVPGNRRKIRQLQNARRHRGVIQDVMSCGFTGFMSLALLLLGSGMFIYLYSASSIFPGLPLRNTARNEHPRRPPPAAVDSVATVDITSKDLYDGIEFANRHGGAWTQGWPVTYKGDEWNQVILNVFVVPHSHNDPGWLRTVEEYYLERTRHILSTILQTLAKDPRRKFIWEEISYLERWWKDVSESERKEFIRLVRNGQLEIVGGGWVMNDEANSHYFAIIEQMVAGNVWLRETVGVTPKNSWAIDPFGHSPTMAYLLKRMGFSNMLIQRTHYEVKKALAQRQSLEFIWRQSWDSDNDTDILCHMMPFYSYDIPHTCGPEPGVCCQFDYWRLPRVGGAQRCPWGHNPEEVTERNVRDKALLLLDQYRKKSTLYESNVLLVPLGDDFRYVSSQEAELQFDNYQAIFDYVNSHAELKARLQFGTLEDYFRALRSQLPVRSFPTLSGDFFTYADREHHYWSGYYVSRPFYKAVDRVLEDQLRAANQLFFFAHATCRPEDPSSFPLPYGEAIVSASRNLALFQHHDGVTGTAKDHVVEDYGMRMHKSLLELQALTAACVEALLNRDAGCKKAAGDEAFYQPEETRSKFNVLPLKKSVTLSTGQVRRLVFHNSLEEDVEQVVTVMVESPSVCVFDSSWNALESQVSPEWSTDRHRLQWSAKLPAMGLSTYFLSESSESCIGASPAEVRVFNLDSGSFTCPPGYSCSFGDEQTIKLGNGNQELAFDASTGLLRSVAGVEAEEEVAYYQSSGSGAYLFLPDGEARPLVQGGGPVYVTEGEMMQEVHAVFKSSIGGHPVTRSCRVFRGETVQARSVEMIYNVELVEDRYNDKEIVARFKTGVKSNRVFHSDLNGFQTIRRETYDKIPLQGNYYPMPSLAFLQDESGRRFSVHTRQAVGVASLGNGWLEMMLDRRLTRDDGRGLGQGVTDNRPISVAFHLLVERNVSTSSSSSNNRSPSLLSHRVSARLNYPLHAFLGRGEDKPSAAAGGKVWSPLVSPLPCDLHVVGLKVLRPRSSSRLEYGLVLQRRGWDESYCRRGGDSCRTMVGETVGLGSSFFKDVTLSQVTRSSLNFVHEMEEDRFSILSRKGASFSSKQGVVTLNPMEIQAYKFSLA